MQTTTTNGPDATTSAICNLMAELQGVCWYILTDGHRARVSERLNDDGAHAALRLLIWQIAQVCPNPPATSELAQLIRMARRYRYAPAERRAA